MAVSTYETQAGWTSGARYTAAADVDVLLYNPGQHGILRFTITTNDTTPTVPLERAAPVGPGDRQPIGLLTGERLWMAGGPIAGIEV